jgi:hypothetical protein
MKYEEVLEDWKFLFEGIDSASDMTGGYVDQEDLCKLLKSPTKATAKSCLLNQIEYWFDAGTEEYNCIMDTERLLRKYPQARPIAEKYGKA